MPLDANVEKELLEKVGAEATAKTKVAIEAAEIALTQKHEEFKKGLMSEKAFEDFKAETMAPINETLKKLETAAKEQGDKMNAFMEKTTSKPKSLEQFIVEKAGEIEKLRNGKENIIITAEELKAAGVYSISNVIPTPSGYAPGIGGAPLEIFDIIRNPRFITSHVDLGRTNQARLAWANEIDDPQGVPAIVAEGAIKPQISHTFTIETSVAKKVAGWIELTDEFEQDLPNFATNVRRKLQEDVERAFDDYIQIAVQLAARPFETASLNDQIEFANFWDAIYAMMGQVGNNNFVPNTVALNWLTNVQLKTKKNSNGTYLLPSFAGEIEGMLAYANKMAVRYGLVGDLKQYKVDIYKDFILKIGWINDEFIYNKFAIVGEMRFHNYISDARKKAIVYDSLTTVANAIEGTGS